MRTIPESLARHARLSPSRLCVADAERALTYKEFFEAALGFAAFLSAHGCAPGARVLVQAGQSVGFAVAAIGAQCARCVSVPVDIDAPPARVLELARLTGAAFAVAREADGLPCVAVLPRDVLPLAEQYAARGIFAAPDPDALSEILFTTGTTGQSKGVMHTFGSEAACAENQVRAPAVSARDVWAAPTPLSHAMGLRKLHATLHAGGTVVITNGVAFAAAFFDAMDRYGVTVLSLTPAYLSFLLRLFPGELALLNGRLRCLNVGAAAAPQADLAALSNLLPDVMVSIVYGSTEASACAYYSYTGAPGKPGCVGRVNVNAKIAILDDAGVPVAAPETSGRIAVSGKCVMRGYYNEPELTRSVLRNGRLLTGDVGYFGSDGLLYLLGRADEVINSGGFKIAPAEIEAAAQALDCVADCACVPAPDDMLGQVPKLFVALRPGHAFSAAAIYAGLAKVLERHLLPREIVLTDSIPRTPSGKPQRALLARRAGPREGL